MRSALTIFSFAILVLLNACKKERVNIPAPSSNHKSSILLKDVMEERVPSPYFHFDYNDSGYVTNISFADELVHYNVIYANKRVSSLVSTTDASVLNYEYDNGKIVRIVKSNSGKILWTYSLAYQNYQLKQVKWFRHDVKDSVLERKVELSYGSDGNLSTYEDYWRDESGILKPSGKFVFADYDNGTNVDDFYVFKNFFEDVLFLPGVKLQKNNPALVQFFGTNNSYEIRYGYHYDKGLPVEKSGIFKQKNGDGKELQLTTRYSYY